MTVICEQPNHPGGVFHDGFGMRPRITERRGRRTIRRLWVAASPRKTTARRLAFYGTFAIGAWLSTAFGRRHDVVFASSPPLPGPLGVAMAARMRRMPYVLDVRDLWPAAAEALGELSNTRIIRVLERGERWLYRHAAAVTTTTRPFCTHIDAVVGSSRAVHLPNGALDELIARPDAPPPADGPFVVGYVGNLGIAQGLDALYTAAELLRDEPIRFLVVGDGPLSQPLQRRAAHLGNVEMRGPVPTVDIGPVLESCHALLIPLRSHKVLESFVPSKLYDAMAVGRPAIVAAAGEPAALVMESGAGVVVPPEDGPALAAAIRSLAGDRDSAAAMGTAGRRAARGHARSLQIERLESVLIEAAA